MTELTPPVNVDKAEQLARAVAKLELNHAIVLEALQWWMRGFQAARERTWTDRPFENAPNLVGIFDLSTIIRDIIRHRDT